MPGLLFLSQRIPYPPNKGEKIRAYQILKYLTQHFTVHLGCLVDDPLDEPYEATLAEMCASSHFAHLDRRRARWQCLSGLLTGEPLSVTFYRDAGLQHWVRDLVAREKPEVIFVYSSNMAPYILDLRAGVPRVVVDLVDVDSEKWRAYAETGQGLMRFVHRREWHKTAALEARIARECDWCSFVSDDEAALFAQGNPGVEGKIRGISNGVDHLYFDPSLPFAPLFATDRANFVFTGTMDYPPNIEAVRWFAQEILPAIQVRLPRAQFHIVGASPAPEVTALAELPGVFVTGRVVDQAGNPVADAEVDVWHASPVGLYENQDATQADHNLRGKLTTNAQGQFWFRTVKMLGYPLPTNGVVGKLLAAQDRHPYRPAHLHTLVHKPGFKVLISQIYDRDDPHYDTDVQFGVTEATSFNFIRHNAPHPTAPDVTAPWYTLDYTYVMEPGEAVLPKPPIK